jgi:hypothetical protein
LVRCRCGRRRRSSGSSQVRAESRVVN